MIRVALLVLAASLSKPELPDLGDHAADGRARRRQARVLDRWPARCRAGATTRPASSACVVDDAEQRAAENRDVELRRRRARSTPRASRRPGRVLRLQRRLSRTVRRRGAAESRCPSASSDVRRRSYRDRATTRLYCWGAADVTKPSLDLPANLTRRRLSMDGSSRLETSTRAPSATPARSTVGVTTRRSRARPTVSPSEIDAITGASVRDARDRRRRLRRHDRARHRVWGAGFAARCGVGLAYDPGPKWNRIAVAQATCADRRPPRPLLRPRRPRRARRDFAARPLLAGLGFDARSMSSRVTAHLRAEHRRRVWCWGTINSVAPEPAGWWPDDRRPRLCPPGRSDRRGAGHRAVVSSGTLLLGATGSARLRPRNRSIRAATAPRPRTLAAAGASHVRDGHALSRSTAGAATRRSAGPQRRRRDRRRGVGGGRRWGRRVVCRRRDRAVLLGARPTGERPAADANPWQLPRHRRRQRVRGRDPGAVDVRRDDRGMGRSVGGVLPHKRLRIGHAEDPHHGSRLSTDRRRGGRGPRLHAQHPRAGQHRALVLGLEHAPPGGLDSCTVDRRSSTHRACA